MTLADWTDSEIVLVAIALNSGATVQAFDDQKNAERLNNLLFDAVQSELKLRRLFPPELLRTLVARAVLQLQKNVEVNDATREEC